MSAVLPRPVQPGLGYEERAVQPYVARHVQRDLRIDERARPV
jgi:hypothetical protein